MEFPSHIVAAGGVVEDGKGNILLVNANHGGWMFPGGQVEVCENVIDAVKREIMEECGVQVSVNRLFAVSSNTTVPHEGFNGVKEIKTKVILDFICAYIEGELRGSDENSESRWVPKDKVMDMIAAPALRIRFQAYLEFKGAVRYYDYETRPEFKVKVDREV